MKKSFPIGGYNCPENTVNALKRYIFWYLLYWICIIQLVNFPDLLDKPPHIVVHLSHAMIDDLQLLKCIWYQAKPPFHQILRIMNQRSKMAGKHLERFTRTIPATLSFSLISNIGSLTLSDFLLHTWCRWREQFFSHSEVSIKLNHGTGRKLCKGNVRHVAHGTENPQLKQGG